MKRVYTVLALSSLLYVSLVAQVCAPNSSATIDGSITEAIYTTTISKMNSNACFGPAIDISAIKLGNDGSNLYIGIIGKIEAGNTNGIGLFLDFSSLTGVAAGQNLQTATTDPFGIHFMDNKFAAGMEVDYVLVAYSAMDNGTNNCYIKAARKTGTEASGYLDNIGLMGVASSGNVGGVFAASLCTAFSNSGTSTTGWEIKIPFSAVGVSLGSTVKVFGAVVSETGYFSNVTVPGNVSGGCLGFDGMGGGTENGTPFCNFNTIGGGPYVSSSVIIPVELLSFDAVAQQDKVLLTWKTATERNNSHFDIERSENGRDWLKIGTVKGAGNSHQPLKYSFVDDAPLSRVNYYRLKQNDWDGKNHYSATVSVNRRLKDKVLSLSPNPVQDKITLNLTDTEGVVEIFDMAGRLIQTIPTNSNQVDVSRLKAGMYQLRLLDKKGLPSNQARFVKQ